jgi:hypothetical protein
MSCNAAFPTFLLDLSHIFALSLWFQKSISGWHSSESECSSRVRAEKRKRRGEGKKE